MLLARPIYPHDMVRFHQGFNFYWDIFQADWPELGEVAQALTTDPEIISELKNHDVPEEGYLYHIVKSISLLLVVFGHENVESLATQFGWSRLTRSAMMFSVNADFFTNTEKLSQFDITTTVMTTVIVGIARDNPRNPRDIVDQIMAILTLPGWLMKPLSLFLSTEKKKLVSDATIH